MEIVFFQISTSNEIVPFELAEFPGRDFYRNAGSSNRKGIELSAHYPINSNWYFNATYSISSMNYSDYEANNINYKGNRLPGLPNHRGTISSIYTMPSGLSLKLSLLSTGGLYLDDANEDFSEAFHLVNFALSYPLMIQNSKLSLFLGINNVTNAEYYDNVRINAFGKRYYEPGTPRHLFGGVKLRL
jgi:iron complex outermembrane receptor protein